MDSSMFNNGVEASMVMQWTVNPPPSGTPGSIPGYSTNFRSVRIEVITADCLSAYGGSIPPQTANYYCQRDLTVREVL